MLLVLCADMRCMDASSSTAAELPYLEPFMPAGPISTRSAVIMSNNTALDPDGDLSNNAWQFYLYNDANISFNGSDWDVDDDSKWPNGHATASNNGSSMTFSFTGSEARPALYRHRVSIPVPDSAHSWSAHSPSCPDQLLNPATQPVLRRHWLQPLGACPAPPRSRALHPASALWAPPAPCSCTPPTAGAQPAAGAPAA